MWHILLDASNVFLRMDVFIAVRHVNLNSSKMFICYLICCCKFTNVSVDPPVVKFVDRDCWRLTDNMFCFLS